MIILQLNLNKVCRHSCCIDMIDYLIAEATFCFYWFSDLRIKKKQGNRVLRIDDS